MKEKASILLFLLFFALLISSGCIRRAELLRTPVREVSAAQIIVALENNRSALKSFWGKARVHLQNSGSITVQPITQRLLVGILFKSPAQMRVEVYGALGTKILAFVQRGSQLDVFLPKSKLLLTGDVETDPLAHATGIEALPEIILETFGFYQFHSQDLISFQRRGDKYIISLQRNGRRERYCVDGRTLQVVQKEVFNPEGRLQRRAIFKNYVRISGINLPRQVELFSDGFRINVKFIRQKVNLKIAEEKFKLKVPADTQRVSI